MFAAIQVHETRAAIVQPGSTNPRVSYDILLLYLRCLLTRSFVARGRCRVTLEESGTLSDRLTGHYWCIMAVAGVLGTRTIFRIRVRP